MLRQLWHSNVRQIACARSTSVLRLCTVDAVNDSEATSQETQPPQETSNAVDTDLVKTPAKPKQTPKPSKKAQVKGKKARQRRTPGRDAKSSGRSFYPNIKSARNWRVVESMFQRDGIKWSMNDYRFAWKRCVVVHLDKNLSRLRMGAACTARGGRQFLRDLMKGTLTQLEREGWKMNGVQARDIGWSAGKQWFMDEKLVDPIQTGLLFGIENREIHMYHAIPVAWAIAHSGQYPVRLFDAFVQKIASFHEDLNLQHCTNILWSMAVCGYYPGQPFLQVIAQVAGQLVHSDEPSVIPQAIADLIWSLGRLNLKSGHEALVHNCIRWAYKKLTDFSAEELLTLAMGLAMLESFGREDMRALAEAFHVVTQKNLLEVHIDQFIALSLLFPPEERVIFHETAFGSEAMGAIISAHHDRQAQIAIQMKNNRFLQLISRQLDKVAEGKYEIGVLTEDRNLALEILVRGDTEDYSVIPVYPMSRSRNVPEIELGEVRIAQRLIEAQGIKFGGFLEWIIPEDNDEPESVSDDSKQTDNV